MTMFATAACCLDESRILVTYICLQHLAVKRLDAATKVLITDHLLLATWRCIAICSFSRASLMIRCDMPVDDGINIGCFYSYANVDLCNLPSTRIRSLKRNHICQIVDMATSGYSYLLAECFVFVSIV